MVGILQRTRTVRSTTTRSDMGYRQLVPTYRCTGTLFRSVLIGTSTAVRVEQDPTVYSCMGSEFIVITGISRGRTIRRYCSYTSTSSDYRSACLRVPTSSGTGSRAGTSARLLVCSSALCSLAILCSLDRMHLYLYSYCTEIHVQL